MNSLQPENMHAGAKPEVFRFAEKLRSNMTEAEKILWEYLRVKPKGFKFRRQHPFSKYVLDFYCHKARLAIELDGGYHEKPLQKQLDEERTLEIQRLGLFELRFKNEEVLNDPIMVLGKILEHISTSNRI